MSLNFKLNNIWHDIRIIVIISITMIRLRRIIGLIDCGMKLNYKDIRENINYVINAFDDYVVHRRQFTRLE